MALNVNVETLRQLIIGLDNCKRLVRELQEEVRRTGAAPNVQDYYAYTIPSPYREIMQGAGLELLPEMDYAALEKRVCEDFERRDIIVNNLDRVCQWCKSPIDTGKLYLCSGETLYDQLSSVPYTCGTFYIFREQKEPFRINGSFMRSEGCAKMQDINRQTAAMNAGKKVPPKNPRTRKRGNS